jgi:hypothetical protein
MGDDILDAPAATMAARRPFALVEPTQVST